MSARGSFLGFAAALLLFAPASAVEVVDLTGEAPTPEALVRALEIESDAPGAFTVVAIGVPFAVGSARLTDQARQTLDALALAMSSSELSDQFFMVQGHTDASGAQDANQRLSYQRAGAVHDYLVDKGIDAQRLAAMGYGEDHPMPGSDPNDERNRRIEIASQLLEPLAKPAGPTQPLPILLEYQVHVTRPDGSHGVVDPTEGPFQAGDRIYLTFVASMTGLFDAYTVTSAGDVTELSHWTLDRGQKVRLPPAPDVMSFEGTGAELLVLQYYPCETARTQSLDLGREILSALPDCTDLPQRAVQADRSRDLAVESDDWGYRAMFVLPVDEVPGAALRGFSLAIPLAYQ